MRKSNKLEPSVVRKMFSFVLQYLDFTLLDYLYSIPNCIREVINVYHLTKLDIDVYFAWTEVKNNTTFGSKTIIIKVVYRCYRHSSSIGLIRILHLWCYFNLLLSTWLYHKSYIFSHLLICISYPN